MPSTKIQHSVHDMTVEAASNYASHLLEMEQRGSDMDSALHRLEQRYGLKPRPNHAPAKPARKIV